jgi:hypothetical protein
MATPNGIEVEIWLRSDQRASTVTIFPPVGEPSAWTDDEVEAVLRGMLRALDLASDPATEREVQLRGFSWIVSPYDQGGVLIAMELQLGAVVAGPFPVAEDVLTKKIDRVMGQHRPLYVPPGSTIQ